MLMTVNEANFQECTLSISGVKSTRVDDSVTAICILRINRRRRTRGIILNSSTATKSSGFLLLDLSTWIQLHEQFDPITTQTEWHWVRTPAKAATSIPCTCSECLFVLSHEIEDNPAEILSDCHGVTKATHRLD